MKSKGPHACYCSVPHPTRCREAVRSVEDAGVEILIKPPPKSLVLNVMKIKDTPSTGERAENGQVMNTKLGYMHKQLSTRALQGRCSPRASIKGL